MLHFLSSSHVDCHEPTDTADRPNAAGAAQIAKLVADVAQSVMAGPAPLTFQHIAPDAPKG